MSDGDGNQSTSLRSSLLTRPNIAAAAVFLVAVIVFASFLVLAPESLRPKGDYNDYDIFYRPVAENLIEGRGYVNDDGSFALHNPPGYAFLLAGIFLTARAIGVAQSTALTGFTVLMMAISAVLIYQLSRELLSQGQALWAALLYITYPITLVVASYRFSEAPFSLVLYLAVLLFVRGMRHGRTNVPMMAVVGLLLGYATLIRPAAIGLALAFLVATLLWRREALRRRLVVVALIVAGNLVVVMPWQLWLMERTDQAVVLSTAGTDSVLDGLTVSFRPQDESGTLWMPDDLRAVMAEMAARRRDSPQSLGEIAGFLGDVARDSPATLAKLVVFKAVRAWYGTNALKWEGLILAVQIPYLAAMATGLVLSLKSNETTRSVVVLIMACVLYFWAVTMAVLPIVRLMAPALGLLSPVATLALVRLWERSRRKTTTLVEVG